MPIELACDRLLSSLSCHLKDGNTYCLLSEHSVDEDRRTICSGLARARDIDNRNMFGGGPGTWQLSLRPQWCKALASNEERRRLRTRVSR